MKQTYRSWAEIDLAAFERNLKKIQAALPSHIRYVAVVKADAYGHGMAPMVRRLMQSGVDCFAVANVYEAAIIRHTGAGWPILLLSPVLEEEESQLIEHDLAATVSSDEECRRLDSLGAKHARPIRVHLKIDTGMGRLGVWHENAKALIEKIFSYEHLQLEGLYTHFSSADSDPDYTALQRTRFLKAIQAVPRDDLIIHADNSAGIDSMDAEGPFNAVRIGLLQFGIPPYPASALGRVAVEPVFSFSARIGIIKDLPAGTAISYGRTHTLNRASRIAVLTAGYGDGIPIALSNKGRVIVRGRSCPILGRVTMDQTIIDVTDSPDAAPGDTATLIGPNGDLAISATEFSTTADTIPWETLCSVTQRVKRVYLGSREL
jgi:alanine racemase